MPSGKNGTGKKGSNYTEKGSAGTSVIGRKGVLPKGRAKKSSSDLPSEDKITDELSKSLGDAERDRLLEECALLQQQKEEVLRKAEQRLASEMTLRKSWKAKEADMKKKLEEKDAEIRNLKALNSRAHGGDASMDVRSLRLVREELKSALKR